MSRRALGPQAIRLIHETAEAVNEIEERAASAEAPKRALKASRRHVSETEKALHPSAALRKCACGVRFIPSTTKGDSPAKCQTCNRSWSKLFVRPII